MRRSAKVSLIVGTTLIGINQGNLILVGSLSPDLFWKVPLTYCDRIKKKVERETRFELATSTLARLRSTN